MTTTPKICFFAWKLGLITVLTQLLIFREFFFVFSGNELIIGLALFNWFVITGLGAIAGRYILRKPSETVLINLFVSLIFIVIFVIIAMYNLKYQIFTMGIAMSPLQILLAIHMVLLPVCFISGLIFTYLNRFFDNSQHNIVRLYAYETLGSISGGLLYGFLLIHFLSTVQILSLLILFLSFTLLFNIFKAGIKPVKIIGLLILSTTLVLLNFTGLYKNSISKLFPFQQIVEINENRFGRQVVAQSQGNYNLYDNSTLVNTNNNEMYVEEAVHFAMTFRPKPEHVLIVSGNIQTLYLEVAKYHAQQVTYIEPDRDLFLLEQKYFSAGRPLNAVSFVFDDARNWLTRSDEYFDVILLNVSEPVSFNSNRFFTHEFFKLLSRRIKPGGVIQLQLPGIENYINRETAQLISSVYNTLSLNFNSVRIVSGNNLYILASDQNLQGEIISKIDSSGIENLYVNSYYMSDEDLNFKSSRIMAKLDQETMVNSDLKPVAYHLGILTWLGKFHTSVYYYLIIPLLILMIALLFFKPLNAGLFGNSFIASSNELLIIFASQALFGFSFYKIALYFSVFMLGLFVGSRFISSLIKISFSTYIYIQLVCIVITGIFCLMLHSLEFYSASLEVLFYLLMFIQSSASGLIFSLAVQLKAGNNHRIADSTYGIELIGSAAGSLAISVFAVPLLGIVTTLYFLMLFNLLLVLLMLVNRKFFRRFT